MNTMIFSSPYPLDALYVTARDAAWEVVDQVQAPIALVGLSILAAMAVACQGNVDALLPPGLLRPTSLFLAMFGQSGERKTTVDNLVSAPLYEHDAKNASLNAEGAAQYEASLSMWEAERAALRKRLVKASQEGEELEQFRSELVAHALLKPAKPAPKRIIHQSITERPFLEALQGDGKSIAILSDEGEIVLKGGAMSKMGVLNKSWDGAASLTLDRADGHVQATNPRVTISFMIQEEVFQDFLDKRGRIARGSGHLARYLVAWPASTVGFRRMTLEDHTWAHLPTFHNRLNELLIEADQRQAQGRPRDKLEFSVEAKELWVASQNWVEPQMQPGRAYAGIKDFASKMLEIASRVAAILHYFHGLEGRISRETLERALNLVWWHLDEFNRLFGDANNAPQHQRNMHNICKHLYNKYWLEHLDKASWNEVRKCGPVRDQDQYEAGVRGLEQQGLVEVKREGDFGKQYIRFNSMAFSQLVFT